MISGYDRPNILKWFYKFQDTFAVLLMCLATLLVFIQVLLRYVFKAPLMGIEELLLFPSIWLYMVGGISASFKKEHISCGILTLYVTKERSIMIFNIVRDALSLIICGWLTYWAFWYFMYSLNVWKESDLLYIPMFFGESAIFLGLVFMLLYAVLDFYEAVHILISRNKSKSNEPRVENSVNERGV